MNFKGKPSTHLGADYNLLARDLQCVLSIAAARVLSARETLNARDVVETASYTFAVLMRKFEQADSEQASDDMFDLALAIAGVGLAVGEALITGTIDLGRSGDLPDPNTN